MSRFNVITILTTAGLVFSFGFLHDSMQRDALIVLLIGYLALFGLGVAFLQLQYFGPAICCGQSDSKKCALTFDDGPDAIATERLLAILKRHNVHATFFCVGKCVLALPELTVRIAAEGHLLANHTYRHGWWTNFLPPFVLTNEILRAQAAFKSTVGVVPRYFRPPVGLTNPGVARVLRRLKLICVGWSVHSHDRNATSADPVVKRIKRGLRNGGIVLLHDGGVAPEPLLQIVEQIIIWGHGEGYQFVRVDQLFDRAEMQQSA